MGRSFFLKGGEMRRWPVSDADREGLRFARGKRETLGLFGWMDGLVDEEVDVHVGVDCF